MKELQYPMLRLNPQCFDYLYDKSAMLRLHGSINHDDVIAAYKKNIKLLHGIIGNCLNLIMQLLLAIL